MVLLYVIRMQIEKEEAQAMKQAAVDKYNEKRQEASPRSSGLNTNFHADNLEKDSKNSD